MKILYVEDEKFLADAVIHLLHKAKIQVDWADDGEKGLNLAMKPNYDAIVLDVMLPKLSGLDILEIIRKRNIKTPVIMLSALSQVEDKIRGLEIGADDYLAKPFKTSELIARLNAVTRRPPLQDNQIYTYEDLKFDIRNRTLNSINLTEKEAEIIEILIKHPNQINSKEQIFSRVWGANEFIDDNYVEVYISYLRSKLKKLNSKVKIKTIRGLGYKLTHV